METDRVDLLTLREAAAFLRVSPRYLELLKAAGEVPFIPLGRRHLFRRSALAEFALEREQLATVRAVRSAAVPAPASPDPRTRP